MPVPPSCGCMECAKCHGRERMRRRRADPTWHRRKPVAERFRDKYVALPNGCWEWIAYTDRYGYGKFKLDERGPIGAHTASYELHTGLKVPVGQTLDHLCHNSDLSCRGGPTCLHRRCVNPAHLALAPGPENQARAKRNMGAPQQHKTHCPQGHPYDGENLSINRKGHKVCRTCKRDDMRARRARKHGTA